METGKNEIKGILFEIVAVAFYIALTFAATVIIMR